MMDTRQYIYRKALDIRLKKLGDTWMSAGYVKDFVPEVVFADDLASTAEVGASEYGFARWLRSHIGPRDQITPNTKGLGDEQSEAIYGICDQKLAIIIGGPGTGKTTAIKRYIEACDDAGLSICLLSPTGRGAVQLSKACDNRPSSTIHSAVRRCDEDFIDADVFVLDEVGMWDSVIGYQLVKLIPPDARVILMGDPGQLPSVEPGNVLEDLCRIPEIPKWHLTQIHRYEDGGPIADACYDILNGHIPQHGEKGIGGFHILLDPENPFECIVRALQKAIRTLDISIYDCRVLTPYRDTAWGLNQFIKSRFNPNTIPVYQTEKQRREGRKPPLVGVNDPIICRKNNWDLNVANGQTGVVDERHLAVFDNGVECNLDEIYWQLGYSSTVHASQAGQWPYVIVYNPSNKGYGFVTREMLNTAVSRATLRCLYIGSEKGIQAAVKTKTRKRLTLIPDFFAGREITEFRTTKGEPIWA